jgi:hypothetical protein
MTEKADDTTELQELCLEAVTTAARDLGLDARAFAEELAQGEIGLLISYLRRATPHLPDVAQQAEVNALLHRLTVWTAARA